MWIYEAAVHGRPREFEKVKQNHRADIQIHTQLSDAMYSLLDMQNIGKDMTRIFKKNMAAMQIVSPHIQHMVLHTL